MKKHLLLNSDNVSRLSKNITKQLKNDGFNINHLSVMGSFAKSLGFPNLHAAQKQDFLQERQEEKSYLIKTSLKVVYLDYFDISEECEETREFTFLVKGSDQKHHCFYLLAKKIGFSSICFSNDVEERFFKFFKDRNIKVPNIFDFFCFHDEKMHNSLFQSVDDIKEFDSIFLDELSQNEEIRLTDYGNALTSIDIIEATPDQIDFMRKYNYIESEIEFSDFFKY